MKKRVAIIVAAVMLTAGVSAAQSPTDFVNLLGGLLARFFGGGAALEVTQNLNRILLADHSGKLADIVSKASDIYTTVDQHLKKYHIEMAKLSSLGSYRAIYGNLRQATSRDTFGKNSAWNENANGSIGAYPSSVIPLPDVGVIMDRMAPQTAIISRYQYSSVELSDGGIQTALNTVGDIRQNDPSLNKAIQNLEKTVYSDSDDDNTDKAIANKTAVANMIAVRQRENQTRLQLIQVEQAALRERRERDQWAVDWNERAERIARSNELKQSMSGASDAVQIPW